MNVKEKLQEGEGVKLSTRPDVRRSRDGDVTEQRVLAAVDLEDVRVSALEGYAIDVVGLRDERDRGADADLDGAEVGHGRKSTGSAPDALPLAQRGDVLFPLGFEPGPVHPCERFVDGLGGLGAVAEGLDEDVGDFAGAGVGGIQEEAPPSIKEMGS